MVKIIVNYIRKAGGTATAIDHAAHRKHRTDKSNTRPDIDAYIGCDHYVIDVMIPHPTAKTHIAKATTPLGVAHAEEINKCNKHEL